ncbi:FecCD family ABC transporter permease [Sphaerochaeta halotolerans]|jgi:iron complex transport system permease protein|uniref:Iron ABC transporter permease n=1 Tax=Sphaerochaeta halotolerans TaxID=2293840 RepID=A0A372MI27_9SPIR|nr:iron ABC transporter permease [Sphaerochaeta halotolerans]MBG0766676.1 iron ABC transporter permease [Spirochaetaceae bacterium]MDK2860340.1 iron complex transport system permease protein [Sphaerochaeta sp.]MDN5332872.1 iron complex transport system permease protein [Sphaerochaeta sp.]MXI85625.1 iron chelate uptake ABC transporter family permease subunit [Sphaerochaeta halotolerans]RFU95419.1 iron ABC transporter permease [Sphaerochaeta halotolerans]
MNARQHYQAERKRRTGLLLGMLGATLLFAFLFLFAGRYPTAGFRFPTDWATNEMTRSIFLRIRLPRIVLALLAGAMLSASGFTFQMLFSNPLVEPGFLGVSQGSAFGAALMIVLGVGSTLLVQLSATFFGLLALLASYLIATRFRFGGWLLRLVLSGIAVSALFSSALGVVKLVAEPTKDLQDITFWMMGGLWNASWSQILSILWVVILSMGILLGYRWKLNLLSLQEKTSFSVGMNPKRDRIILLIVATVGTTVTISITGLIGWVGLITPHLGRKLFGSDSSTSLPGSMILGSFFLLVCDTIGRTVLATEIPIGLLTSFLGAIIFMIILSLKHQEGKA